MKIIEELIKNNSILIIEKKKIKIISYKIDDIEDEDIDTKIEKYLNNNGCEIIGSGVGNGIKNFTYSKNNP